MQRMEMPRLVDDGTGKLVLQQTNEDRPFVPRVFGEIPTPRFSKEGEALDATVTENGTVIVEQNQPEESAEEKSKKHPVKKLKTVTAFRKRGRQPVTA
jgi:hypothetical protein